MDLKHFISEYKPTTLIIYSWSDFSDIWSFYACIEYYNTIASIVKSSKTKIMMFNITIEGHKFILCSDPNDVKTKNWHRVKELCVQHGIVFKNQTFVQFIKQL